MKKGNVVIVLILLIRYCSVYFPIIFLDNWIVAENTERFDNYSIVYFISRGVFIGCAIFALSFFTTIKYLKRFIYYMSCCEFFEILRMLFVMLAIENIVIHNSKLWEYQLSILINIAVAGYFFYQWRKTDYINKI